MFNWQQFVIGSGNGLGLNSSKPIPEQRWTSLFTCFMSQGLIEVQNRLKTLRPAKKWCFANDSLQHSFLNDNRIKIQIFTVCVPFPSTISQCWFNLWFGAEKAPSWLWRRNAVKITLTYSYSYSRLMLHYVLSFLKGYTPLICSYQLWINVRSILACSMRSVAIRGNIGRVRIIGKYVQWALKRLVWIGIHKIKWIMLRCQSNRSNILYIFNLISCVDIWLVLHKNSYIYIYIYIERERES